MTEPVFIQGMRRSGTTVLFDLLLEDPGLTCFYEPLAAGRPSIGGGSGLHECDLLAPVRDARERFAAGRPDLDDVSVLNHGAPRDWRLEFEPDLPPLVRDYLAFLLGEGEAVAVKFTRMAEKVPVLAELAPGARLLHVVRDPRAVTTSYLLGRDRRRARELADPDAFFERVSDWDQWSSRAFSEHILAGRPLRPPARDFERILAIWGQTLAATRRGADRGFGPHSLLMRHEDLRAAPAATIRRVYAFLDRALPAAVERYAVDVVRPDQDVVAPDDPRWEEAYDRLGLREAVRAAGYAA